MSAVPIYPIIVCSFELAGVFWTSVFWTAPNFSAISVCCKIFGNRCGATVTSLYLFYQHMTAIRQTCPWEVCLIFVPILLLQGYGLLQGFDVKAILTGKAHFGQVGRVGLGGPAAKDQGVDPSGGQLGVEIGPDGTVAVGGGGVVQQHLQGALPAVGTQQHAGRVASVADDVDPVGRAVWGEVRKIRLDVRLVVVQQVVQQALALYTLYQVIAPVPLVQFDEIVDVDSHQEDVHQCGGVGVDHQGVDRKNPAAQGVDYPQLDHGRHQHGGHHQSGAQITDQLDHNANPPYNICMNHIIPPGQGPGKPLALEESTLTRILFGNQ